MKYKSKNILISAILLISNPLANAHPEGDKELTRSDLINVDLEKKTISFPAEVNMKEGMIEYTIVNNVSGKTHESVFSTPIKPNDIFAELEKIIPEPANLSKLDPKMHGPNVKLNHPLISKKAQVSITVQWKEGDILKVSKLEDLLQFRDKVKKAPFRTQPLGQWLYMARQKKPQASVNIAGTHLSQDCVFSFHHPTDAFFDSRFFPLTEKLPPVGSEVTIIVQHLVEKKSQKKS